MTIYIYIIIQLYLYLCGYDELSCEAVENDFLPWLMDSVDEQLRRSEAGRHLLDALIRDVVRTRSEQFDKLAADEARGVQTAAAADDAAADADAAAVAPEEVPTDATEAVTDAVPAGEESGANQEVV
jgi:hypothetical protein